jgi:hypothetical protein
MPQKWGVLEVSAQLRWRQGQLLAELPHSEGITEHKNLYGIFIFILPAIPGGCLPGIKGQKGSWAFQKINYYMHFTFQNAPLDFMLDCKCTSKYTKENLGSFHTLQFKF